MLEEVETENTKAMTAMLPQSTDTSWEARFVECGPDLSRVRIVDTGHLTRCELVHQKNIIIRDTF